jgi:Domain of unknown function (DUF4892)
MSVKCLYKKFACSPALLVILLLGSGPVMATGPEQLLQRLNEFPHAQQLVFSEQDVIDHEVGLGAINKVAGAWRFKHSERISGVLTAYTWQIVDGFTSLEVMEELVASVEATRNSELLFSCDARACGQGVQWANRVFHQRILYGREDMQRYRVYALQGEGGEEYRLIIYSASRTADRQYLHAELLQIKVSP